MVTTDMIQGPLRNPGLLILGHLLLLLVGCVPEARRSESLLPDPRVRTLVREQTYQTSDLDSKVAAQTIALAQVKWRLLDEVATALELAPAILQAHLTREQLVTLVAGAVQPELVAERWDGQRYWLKAQATLTPENVAVILASLHWDRQRIAALQDMRQQTENTLQELLRLKETLATASHDIDTVLLRHTYAKKLTVLTALDWCNRGLVAANRGDAVGAAMAFSLVIELLPHNAAAYYQRSLAYAALGWHQQALDDVSQAIAWRSNEAAYYQRRGTLYAQLNEAQHALQDFSRAIDLEPSLGEAYASRGTLYSKLGDPQRAVQDFSQAIALRPDDHHAYSKRGTAYSLLGEHERAVQDFTRVIELAPQHPEAYYHRGLAYEKLGQHQQVIADLSRALAFDATLKDAYYARGKAYAEVGEHRQAIQDYQRALKLDPQFADTYYALGQAYLRVGNQPQAIASFHQAARRGCKPLIQQVQTRLQKAGLKPGPADGVLGPQTVEALRSYQKRRTLPVTGALDEATLGALLTGT